MGNTIGTEVSPPTLDEMLRKTEPAVEERTTFDCFNSILRVWIFSPHKEDDLYVTNEAISLSNFKGFEDHSCYLVLHLYRNKPVKDISPKASNAPPTPTILDIAKSTAENLSPRGQVNCFGGFHSVSNSLSKNSTGTDSKYDIYIWNGKNASQLIKANSLAKVFELDAALKDGKGMDGVINREGNLVPLASVICCANKVLYSDEWVPLLKNNHLLSTLNDAHPFFGAVVQSPKGRSVSFANTNLEERIVQSVPKTSSKRITTKRKRPKPRAERGVSSAKRSSRKGLPVINLPTNTTPNNNMVPLPFPVDKTNFRSISLPASKIAQLQLNPDEFKIDMSQVGNTDEIHLPQESKAKKIARLDPICSKITEHLYLGSDTVARDFELLQNCQVTHILNCAATACENYFPDRFTYKSLFLYDGSNENISCLFYNVLDFLENAISNGGTVFVHCHQGISRSSAMLILYLMWKEHADYQETHERVKAIREVANPNAGFTCQLLNWQRLRESKERPSCIFAVFPHCEQDPEQFIMKHVNPTGDLSLTLFDSRGCFIIWTSKKLFLWIGNECTSILEEQGLLYAKRLQKFEKAAKPRREVQGKESKKFLSLFPNPNVAVQQVESYTQHYDLLKRNE
mmetsp:Transcript_16030/g.27333  ORF Transcript_16030/g.27333 Transcript_16030/m.27333 type:complete len:628 (-) Transcript_16030:80-1963(-)